MSIKLGELLVSNKLITEHQLKEGLHAQTVFGGKLGTNLVELGYLNEMDLAKLLSAQLDIPCIEEGELENIDKKILALVPTKLVEKHRVLPLEADERKLRLAMSDPTNYPAIDEITFATGMRIKPIVAPEILLVYAIEKYYDVKRAVRYIRAAGMAQNLSETSPYAGATEARLLDLGAEEVAAKAASAKGAAAEGAEVDGFPIHQVVIELVRARRTEDIMEIVRWFVPQDFKYTAVFLFSGENAIGGTQVGCKLTNEEFEEFTFPVESSEMLSKIFNTKETFAGMPSLSGIDDWYFSELGIPKDRPIICFPVISGDKLQAIILASENKKGELVDIMDIYALFCKKLGMAFDLIGLKDRIIDLSQLED